MLIIVGSRREGNCYNLAKIKTSSSAGGVVGQCSNSCKIINCYNLGEIYGKVVGGISGYTMISDI